jgi:hypothetical protein
LYLLVHCFFLIKKNERRPRLAKPFLFSTLFRSGFYGRIILILRSAL